MIEVLKKLRVTVVSTLSALFTQMFKLYNTDNKLYINKNHEKRNFELIKFRVNFLYMRKTADKNQSMNSTGIFKVILTLKSEYYLK